MFAAITGLCPFRLNRVSFTLAFTIATLVITKLINGYIFCGLNRNFYMDLPFGVIQFAGYCIVPLLGLAINRRPKTKGECCRCVFVVVLISIWLVGTGIGTFWFFLYEGFFGSFNEDGRHKLLSRNPAALDPFNVCGNRTNENVAAQFSNAMPTFSVLQRIDLIYKIFNGLGWLLPMVFACPAFGLFLASLAEREEEHLPLEEDPEAGNLDDNDETIIWTAEIETGENEEFSAAAKLETIDESSEQPAMIDIDCESARTDRVRAAEQPKMEGYAEDN